jgi:hypothetical protein
MKSFTKILLASLLCLGCQALEDTKRSFAEERTYRQLVFESLEACDEYNAHNPYVNCYRWVTFSTDASVAMVVTDIVNAGTYEIQGQQISLKMDANSDVPERITLTLSEDEESLSWDGETWDLAK